MRFDVITLFPEVFATVTDSGITSRAMKRGLWELGLWNPRDVTTDLHRTVDDRPFGGGPGMVLMAEPLALTLERIRAAGNAGRVVAFAPGGVPLTDAAVRRIADDDAPLVLVCGRYEGIDERFLQSFVDEQYCIGDFVLSGGELPALCLIDAVVRRIPGAIKELSASDESFATGLLDAPHYTRPEVWRGQAVPKILLSGDHAKVERWNRDRALEATCKTRPDLITIARSRNQLSREDEKFLQALACGAQSDQPQTGG